MGRHEGEADMSHAEVQRFAADLKLNEALRHEIDNITRDPMPSTR